MKEATGLDEQPLSLSSRPLAAPLNHRGVSNMASSTVSPGRYGYAASGRDVMSDVMLSTRHLPSSHKPAMVNPSSELTTSYKRLVQSDVPRDAAELAGRHSHTKPAKTRSKGTTSDSVTHTQYVSLSPSGRKAKRAKVSKKDQWEKPTASGASRSGAELSSLSRRSKTFVVDSAIQSSSSAIQTHPEVVLRGADASHHGPEARRGEAVAPGPDALLTPSERLLKKQEILSRLSERLSYESHESDDPQAETTPSRKSRSLKDTFAGSREDKFAGSREDKFAGGRETREGARNPAREGRFPPRPKSAGQLRYYDSDGSDNSSLDGEIEIVDIDKELQAEPTEPAPYFRGVEPLLIPEVVVHSNNPQTSPPLFNRFRPRQSKPLQQNAHQQQLYVQQLPVPKHQQQKQAHVPDGSSKQHAPGFRQRHGSGESEFSTFSDTVVNGNHAHVRRRFLSDPDIDSGVSLDKSLAPSENPADVKSRSNGVSQKSENASKRPPAHGELETFSSSAAASLRRATRDRVYSEAMERVLSRYSELAVRERTQDSASRSTSRTLRQPSGTALSSTVAPGKASFLPGNSAGFGAGRGLPPRKLKPIARKSDSEIS